MTRHHRFRPIYYVRSWSRRGTQGYYSCWLHSYFCWFQPGRTDSVARQLSVNVYKAETFWCFTEQELWAERIDR